MEDGSDGTVSLAVSSPPLNNGEQEVMANFPNLENNTTTTLKVNGDYLVDSAQENDDKDSSDCDALIIDESATQKKKKGTKSEEEFHHTNPYFSESIFELSNQYKAPDESKKKVVKTAGNRKTREKNGKPKLREYAQYLGLQPTVQFKCSKCSSSGFQSLQALNEHLTQCNSRAAPITPPPVQSNNATNFRVTRKVFLCSACGTYYENWNLFLHMREVHRRFVCLYCLGMFPHAEKLSLHLISKHNCTPAQYETVYDFFRDYKEPCFLMCCECQMVFNEQEDFTHHACIDDVQNKEQEPLKTETSDKLNLVNLNCDTSVDETQHDSQGKIIDGLYQKTDETQMSNKEMHVDQEENDRSSNCAGNLESNCNSEINMIEDELNHVTKTILNEEMKSLSDHSDNEDNVNMEEGSDGDEAKITSDETQTSTIFEDIRKVPKVTLKLPKITPYTPEEDEEYQSEDSEKLTMEIDKESDPDITNETTEEIPNSNIMNTDEESIKKSEMMVPTAGPDINIIELVLEQPLDKFEIKTLLQKCLGATIGTCLYCNHARKIAVNGKQLGLHAIAEHRYSAIVRSITAEELIPESFNSRIKESFQDLENVYFNLESSSSEGGVTFLHIFECFQCRYSTTVHKELYLHNRKLHAKAILLCIMCKTSFYSYSELICHLCPGIYALESDVQFRCCLCVSDDLPSAFRLMVHLRKKHNVCDVCLEMCHNQSKLSNHVWKHKLHHLCYRCGIAYRNKPDITKHLYWKHGTESVLCKKCLQKKWPHVYHFCIPPTSFTCEECNLTFSRAVRLMVHKRLHAEEYPHACKEEECAEKFISKKLLMKHEFKHRQPIEEVKVEEKVEVNVEQKEEISVAEINNDTSEEISKVVETSDAKEEILEKPKPKVDVYDLPELNLSESDSDSEEEEIETKPVESDPQPEPSVILNEILESSQMQEGVSKNVENLETKENSMEEDKPQVLENIWDDFKNYQANIAKLDILTDVGKENEEPDILTDVAVPATFEEALRDHDYCAPTMDTLMEQDGLPNSQDLGPDHDYCSEQKEEGKKVSLQQNNAVKKGRTTDSSSDSDSSSCTCGSNCSCSSSSDSSSSTSDSSESDSSSEEGRRKQQARREKRRLRKTKQESESAQIDVVSTDKDNPQATTPVGPAPSADLPIQESDLETTESDTDEDFYDKQPQKLASKLIAEKREKILQMASGIGPYINGSMIDSRPSTPNIPEESSKPKKKSKSKKKKKKKSSKHDSEHKNLNIPNSYALPPLSISIPKNSPSVTPAYSPVVNNTIVNLNSNSNNLVLSENDSSTRASKRRRVPNKFYGYSSDEEAEKVTQNVPSLKFRKVDLPSPKSPLVVPPLTIKTTPTIPMVEPISIRMTSKPGELRVQPLRLPFIKRTAPKIKPPKPPALREQDAGTDSNTSSSEEEGVPKVKETPALYCYCRCPYDEVSEMIGCDSDDCAIEWFHFECVGIMVPPKGQWYCPDCRKKKQQRREMLQATQMSS